MYILEFYQYIELSSNAHNAVFFCAIHDPMLSLTF